MADHILNKYFDVCLLKQIVAFLITAFFNDHIISIFSFLFYIRAVTISDFHYTTLKTIHYSVELKK